MVVLERGEKKRGGVNPIPNVFGIWLRMARRSADLTMRELGERAEISSAYISYLERGGNGHPGEAANPSKEVVKRLAAALGVKEEEAMLKAGYAPNAPSQIVYFSENGSVQEIPEGKFAQAKEIVGEEKIRLLEENLNEIKAQLAELLRRTEREGK